MDGDRLLFQHPLARQRVPPLALATRGTSGFTDWPDGVLEACASDAEFYGSELLAEWFSDHRLPEWLRESGPELMTCDYITDDNLRSCCYEMCNVDPACCSGGWDLLCSKQLRDFCTVLPTTPNCSGFPASPGINPQEIACCQSFCAEEPLCCLQQWDTMCQQLAVQHCGMIHPNPGDFNQDIRYCGAQNPGAPSFNLTCFNYSYYEHDKCWGACRGFAVCNQEMLQRMLMACEEDLLLPPQLRKCVVHGPNGVTDTLCHDNAFLILNALSKSHYCSICPQSAECLGPPRVLGGFGGTFTLDSVPFSGSEGNLLKYLRF